MCQSYPDLADQLRAFLSNEDAVGEASGESPQSETETPPEDRETIAPVKQSPVGQLTGQTIAGRYRLDKVLGSGAMGCVYLAGDLVRESLVAVKTPFFEGPHETDLKRRFKREATALAAIQHSNVCRIFEHGEHAGTPYLVMEYIAGPTLADLVQADGLEPRQVATWCQGIADGLAAAHAAGIIHRDLKPRNVLLETKTGRVVVTDFGLARFTDETESRLTLDGIVMGTPAYMPPEQIEGDWEQVGPRSDIYSLGIVLYELLTGQPPFTGRMAAVLGKILRDKIEPLRKVRAAIDRELEHVCETMTAKKFADRYPSARAVSAALADYLSNTDPAAKVQRRQAGQLATEREARREQVMALCRKGQYAEAATLLKEISKWTGSGTEEYVRWAKLEMERLRKVPERLRRDQSLLYDTGRQLFAKHDYAAVVQLLADIPANYRSEAVQKLLDKSTDRQDEVDLLQLTIQDAVERKQLKGVEKSIRRLLVLKPGYTPAKELLATLQGYQQRGSKAYRFSKRGELLPAEGLGLLSGVRLVVFVGVLAFLLLTLYVKKYLNESTVGNRDGTGVGRELEQQRAEPPVIPIAPALFDATQPRTAAEAQASQAEWAKHLKTQVETTNNIGMQLTLIPSGEFRMGSSDADLDALLKLYPTLKKETFADEQPQHRVRITKPFYLGVHEVTKGQFATFVKAKSYQTDAEKDGKGGYGQDAEGNYEQKPEYTWKNHSFPQTDDHSVVNVSWNDAVAFCEWLSAKEGKTYRLPTEAEWEYACRAGTTSLWGMGNDPEGLARIGNVIDGTAKAKFNFKESITAEDGFVFTAPVGQFRANAFGLFDMHGNVFEWCADVYDEKAYAGRSGVTSDPEVNAGTVDRRVLRGGSWSGFARNSRSAFRNRSSPDIRVSFTGFRVVRTQ